LNHFDPDLGILKRQQALGILTPFFISLSATIEYGMADKR
jgi:hypothetical protein